MTKTRKATTRKPVKAKSSLPIADLIRIARTREAVQSWYFDTKLALDTLRAITDRMTARISTDPKCVLAEFLKFEDIRCFRNALDRADTELCNIAPISGGVDITDPVAAMDGEDE